MSSLKKRGDKRLLKVQKLRREILGKRKRKLRIPDNVIKVESPSPEKVHERVHEVTINFIKKILEN